MKYMYTYLTFVVFSETSILLKAEFELPSRQMLEYVLVRLIGAVALLQQISSRCKQFVGYVVSTLYMYYIYYRFIVRFPIGWDFLFIKFIILHLLLSCCCCCLPTPMTLARWGESRCSRLWSTRQLLRPSGQQCSNSGGVCPQIQG